MRTTPKAVKDYLEGEIARAKRKKLLVKLYMSAATCMCNSAQQISAWACTAQEQQMGEFRYTAEKRIRAARDVK
jgi:hypothetical protein